MKQSPDALKEETLDPEDRMSMRAPGQRIPDDAPDYLETLGDRPAWQLQAGEVGKAGQDRLGDLDPSASLRACLLWAVDERSQQLGEVAGVGVGGDAVSRLLAQGEQLQAG